MRKIFALLRSPRSTIARAPFFVSLTLLLVLGLQSCTTVREPLKAYAGDPLPASELALVSGDVFYRKDWLNSYVDAVRFIRVDENEIDNNRAYDELYLEPGSREIEVYYSWGMGARIGLAPAMVNYAASREAISQVLQLEAEAGQHYFVRMRPVFSGQGTDINSLDYVEFWVEDASGRVVSRPEEDDSATNS